MIRGDGTVALEGTAVCYTMAITPGNPHDRPAERVPAHAPEVDQMTAPAGSATAAHQEPAVGRGDLIMPGDPRHDDAPQAEQPDTGGRRWAVLAVVSAAQFLIILDLWVVNIALPTLQRDFAPATLSDVSWILDVYAIVLAALLLPAGRAADSIGRRACFLAGLVVFGIASLGCAVAPELPALIACRALQAAGAAVLMPASLGLALSVFPSHQRGTAVGVWAGVGAVAAGSGPVLGGLLVASSWRWIFLINLPVILATLAAGVAILPRRGGQRPSWRIDSVGTVLVLGAVGLVCTALTEAPAWPSARTWPVLAAGLVLAAAFVAHIRGHPDPLVAPRLFSVRPFRAGAAGLVAYYTGFAAMLLGTMLLLTVQWHFTVLQAAVGIAPAPITAGIVSPFSGRLSARFGIRSTVVAGAFFSRRPGPGRWSAPEAAPPTRRSCCRACCCGAWPTRSSSPRCSPPPAPCRARSWRRAQRCWPQHASSGRPWGWRSSWPCSAPVRQRAWPGSSVPGLLS